MMENKRILVTGGDEAINLGSGQDQRVIDMANIINRLTGNDSGIVYTERRNWDV